MMGKQEDESDVPSVKPPILLTMKAVSAVTHGR